MITLINCKFKLQVLGIHMEQIGSGALFTDELSRKIPNSLSWEYNFVQDQIKIWVENGTEIPDLSEFGEVFSYESFVG